MCPSGSAEARERMPGFLPPSIASAEGATSLIATSPSTCVEVEVSTPWYPGPTTAIG